MAEGFAVVIPALNEEQIIGQTLTELAGAASTGAIAPYALGQIIVVDNGSTDRTAEIAREHGAQVVREPRRGYGSACKAGIAALKSGVEIIAFMDGDGSDDPADLPRLLQPIQRGNADLVIGSRVLGEREAGSLMPHQQFGNWLATFLIRVFYGARYTDLGPFRAIGRDALARLAMRDTGHGWPIEMQIKAHRHQLRVLEVPVSHRRRRGGKSKISGNWRGSILAGAKIIWTILRYRVQSSLQ